MGVFSRKNRDRIEDGVEVVTVGWSLFKWIRSLFKGKKSTPPALPPATPPPIHRPSESVRCKGRSAAQGARCDLPTGHAGPHRVIWP